MLSPFFGVSSHIMLSYCLNKLKLSKVLRFGIMVLSLTIFAINSIFMLDFAINPIKNKNCYFSISC